MELNGMAKRFRVKCARNHFYPRYYLAIYPDVAAKKNTVKYAIKHYHEKGIKEGRSPNPFFIPAYYKKKYPKTLGKLSNTKLLNHWVHEGLEEGRKGSPAFDPKWYLKKYKDVAKSVGAKNYRGAYRHFLKHGIREGRQGSSDYLSHEYGKPLWDRCFPGPSFTKRAQAKSSWIAMSTGYKPFDGLRFVLTAVSRAMSAFEAGKLIYEVYDSLIEKAQEAAMWESFRDTWETRIEHETIERGDVMRA
jgi:hypothetical protein